MGVNPRELTYTGLEYWKRRVLPDVHGGRMYLVTLIVEGGLPMRILRAERAGMAYYMKRVLVDLDQFGVGEDAAGKIAAAHGCRLPIRLRNEGIFELAGRLLLGVLRLRDKLPDPPEGDAVSWLEANHSGWRNDLPLDVEDEAARHLLSGLVREAVVLRHRRGRIASLVTRILISSKDGWRPAVETGEEGRLDDMAIPGMITSILNGVVRARFHAAGALEATTPGPLAIIRHVDGDDPGWDVEPLVSGPIRLPCSPATAVEFNLRIDGRDRCRFTPTGGDPLPTGPWVFEACREDDGITIPTELSFVAGGSVRSRAIRLFTAFPGSLSSVDASAGTVVDIGPVTGTDRRLAAVTGTVRISDGESNPAVVVRAGEATDDATRLLVIGHPSAWHVEGSVAVLGVPEFKERQANGAVSHVERRHLRWRPTHRGSRWRTMSNDDPPCGSIDIAIVRNNELVDQTRVAILPKDMSVQALPIDQSHCELVLSGLAGILVSIDADSVPEHTVASATSEGCGAWRVGLLSERIPPTSIVLNMLFPGGGALRCRLPIPMKGGGFLDANGSWLTASRRVALDQLYGLRVRPGASGGTLFAWVGGNGNAGRHLWVRRHIDEECSLSPLRAAFLRLLAVAPSISAALDTIFRVNLDGGGRSPELQLSWFDLEFSLDRPSSTLRLKAQHWSGLNPSERDAIQVLCRPIDDPASEERQIMTELGEPGERPFWKLGDAGLAPGGWLVYGRVADRYRLRPILWTAPGERTEAVDSEGLAGCSRIADYRNRQAALMNALDRMVVQPDHADWDILDGALDVLQGRLPLVTLDVFPLLAKSPAALLSLLSRAQADRVASILKMDSELAFLWVLLPVDAWCSAFERLRNFRMDGAKKEGVSPAILEIMTRQVNQDILDTLRAICEIKPYLKQTAMLVREHLGLAQAADCTGAKIIHPDFRQAMLRILDDERMKLRRRAADQQWPDWYDFRNRFGCLPKENLVGLPHVLPVLDTPFVAAGIAVNGWGSDPEMVQALRLCREFDQDWFDVAYPIAVGLAAAQTRMSRQ